MERPASERREHVRHPMAAAVELYHEPTRRSFPARSVDCSAGGMLMYVPAQTPVAAGQAIRLTFSKAGKGEMAALTGKTTNATVVRVERAKIISLGRLPVGVKFSQPLETQNDA